MENLIYPCLWFNGKAREAAELYCSAFKNSEITSDNKLVVTFESAGQKFMCLNGGPEFTINPSISFFVVCETSEEIEKVWNTLLEGGSVLMPLDKYEWSTKYGWLQDRFGVSWQLSFGVIENISQKFTPALMFTGNQNGKAEQAVQFYTSVFKESGIIGIFKYVKGDNDIEGNVKHAQFRLGNQLFITMDSSLMHNFSFNEAISLVVECNTQKEIDYYWDKLTDEGEEVQCGWLKDRFGVSWQIVPTILNELMSDPSKSQRVIDAFMKMKKFEIDKLINL
jgi:predicted 3-demethylubiquinone-9 3-methyltransferase (glyoxalase superfamily)